MLNMGPNNNALRRLIWLRGARGGGMGKENISLTAGAAPKLVTVSKKSKVTSCAVSFEPWQEGSGDPAPDNVRPVRGWHGVKLTRARQAFKCIPTNYTAGQVLETKSGVSWQYLGGGKYRVWGTAGSSAVMDEVLINNFTTPDTTVTDRRIKFNNPQITNYINVIFYFTNGASDSWGLSAVNREQSYNVMADKTVKGMMINVTNPSADFDITFMPEFVCIDGMETVSVAFPVFGKNLLDPAQKSTYASGEGARWYYTDGITLNANQAYTFSVSGTSQYIHLYIVDMATGTYLAHANTTITYTPTETVTVYLLAYRSGDVIQNANNFQLEKGSTATAYEPFNNTVYGGSVDVVTGAAEKKWGISNISTLDFTPSSSLTHVFRSDSLIGIIKEPITAAINPSAISDIYKSMAWAPISASDHGRFSIADVSSGSHGRVVFIYHNADNTSDFV